MVEFPSKCIIAFVCSLQFKPVNRVDVRTRNISESNTISTEIKSTIELTLSFNSNSTTSD